MPPLVQPGLPAPDFHLSLSDGATEWALRLKDTPASFKERPLLAQRLPNSAGGRFGDWEPGMSYLEQRDWSGGRGREDFAGEATRFSDSLAAWSATPGVALPAPQWRYAQGVRDAVERMPGRLRWQGLHGATRALSVPLTTGVTGLSLAAAQLWLRQAGTPPGALEISVWSDEPATLAEIVDDIVGAGCSIDAAAALAGTGGLKVAIADTDPTYVRWNWGNGDLAFRAGLLLDLNNLTMADGDLFTLVQIAGLGAGAAYNVQLTRESGVLKLRHTCRIDSGAITNADWIALDDLSVRLDMEWAAAAHADSEDGYGVLRVFDADGLAREETIANLDNAARNVNDFAVGAFLGIDAGTSGEIYIDQVAFLGDATGQRAGFDGGGAFARLPGGVVSIPATQAAAGYGELVKAEFPAAMPLDPDAIYHLQLLAPETSAADHGWQVGVDPAAGDGAASADGLAWLSGAAPPFARLLGEYGARRWHFFELARALYAAEQPADGGAGRILLNGDRGFATGGSADTLVDADSGQYGVWPNDHWAGAQVEIIFGAGKGQVRAITGNDGDTLSVARDWDLAPDATSFYVISASDHWIELSGSPLSAPVSAVAVHEDIAMLAQGDDGVLHRLRFNAALSPPGHEFDANGAVQGSLIHAFSDPDGTVRIWRVRNGAISEAAPTPWGTDLSFGAPAQLGSLLTPVTNIADFDGRALLFKPEEVWQYAGGAFSRIALGYERSADPRNGRAAKALGGALYFTWGDGLGRWDGAQLSEFGPHAGLGLPAGRRGWVSALAAANVEWLLAAINAGEGGASSVLLHNGQGWHEVFRAPEGEAISALHWGHTPGAPPRLWAGVGGEIVGLRFPMGTRDPREDPAYTPQHEAVIESGVLDLGAAALPKYFESVRIVLGGLAGEARAEAFIQLDEGVGGAAWLPLGEITASGLGGLPIAAGEAYQAKLRVHLHSSGDLPALEALVIEGALRVPLRCRFAAEIDFAVVAGIGADGPLNERGDALAFLQDAARAARPLTLGALWPHLHGVTVLLDPPALQHNGLDPQSGDWAGTLTLAMREVE